MGGCYCCRSRIGREEQALECLKKVVEKSRKPLVMDADALNLLAEENGKELAEKLRTQGAEGRIIILTPHVGELSRLLAKTIPNARRSFRSVAENWQNGFTVWRLPRMQERLYVKNRENFI